MSDYAVEVYYAGHEEPQARVLLDGFSNKEAEDWWLSVKGEIEHVAGELAPDYEIRTPSGELVVIEPARVSRIDLVDA